MGRANKSLSRQAVVESVNVTDELITFGLADGRQLSAPTSWSGRLARATQRQRANYAIDADGLIVAWPDIDEHIGVWTMLGVPEEEVIGGTA